MNFRKKTISVIGLGYIGLPTAAILSSKGYNVIGIDNNTKIINQIKKKKIHIIETGLEKLVNKSISSKKLKVTSHYEAADIYIICVPTPFHDSSNPPEPNLEYIISVINSIKGLLKKDDIIILESTSPVGTLNKIKKILDINKVDTENLYMAYCPERVIPGNTIKELIFNDRVIGGINNASTDVVALFYSTFIKGKTLKTNSKTAELCKLAENSYRDINIAFANELSLICEKKKLMFGI